MRLTGAMASSSSRQVTFKLEESETKRGFAPVAPGPRPGPPPIRVNCLLPDGNTVTRLVPYTCDVRRAQVLVAACTQGLARTAVDQLEWWVGGTRADGSQRLADLQEHGLLDVVLTVDRPGLLAGTQVTEVTLNHDCLWVAAHLAIRALPEAASVRVPDTPSIFKCMIVDHMRSRRGPAYWAWDGLDPLGSTRIT